VIRGHLLPGHPRAATVTGMHLRAAFAAIALTAAGLFTGTAAQSQASTVCAPHPAVCGFPEAKTTGYTVPLAALRQVPQQVRSGPGWSYTGGALVITGAGTTLAGITTSSTIVVAAPHVTITNSRIYGALTNQPGIALEPAANGTTITDTLIAGTNATSGTMLVGIKDVQGNPVTGTQIIRCDIYHASSGVQIYEGTIADSYIHDLGNTGTEHLEDYNSTGNSGYRVTIRHNTLFNPSPQTAAVYLGADFSPSQNVQITGNLLAGGGYTVYGGGVGVGPHAAPAGIVVTGNVFSRIYFAQGGRFGPVAYFDQGHGDAWSSNTWDGTTTPVLP
jgi:hypothetical protein